MRTQRRFTGLMPNNSRSRNIDTFFNARYRNLLDMGDMKDSFNYPMINEKEYEDHMVLEIAMPGVKKEDINVLSESGFIQVMVEDRQALISSADNYKMKEFNYYSLNQKFAIPENAVEQEIGASYENGVLSIKVPIAPKNEESSHRQKVHIQ